MLKHRLHTAVILATAAVAPLSLEAFRLPACLGGQSEKAASYTTKNASSEEVGSKPVSRKGNLCSQLFRKKRKEAPRHGFEGLLLQQATVITNENNQADVGIAKISMASTIPAQTANTQKKSVLFDSQTTSGLDTLSATTQPAVQQKNTGNVTDNKALASSAPAPVDQRAEVSDQPPNPRWTLFLQNQIETLPDMPTPTEASADSIRWSTIIATISPFRTSPQQPSLEVISEDPETKPDREAQAKQLKAELDQVLLEPRAASENKRLSALTQPNSLPTHLKGENNKKSEASVDLSALPAIHTIKANQTVVTSARMQTSRPKSAARRNKAAKKAS